MSTTPEQRLWQTVLAQAITGATRESASREEDRMAMLGRALGSTVAGTTSGGAALSPGLTRTRCAMRGGRGG